MGRKKKRPIVADEEVGVAGTLLPHHDGAGVGQQPLPAKRQQIEPHRKTESYLVRKYRPEKHYDAMDAFTKYTKAHRMLDATYMRWDNGSAETEHSDKPFVFCIKVGGVELGWGRGRSREIAMDNACRAVFALVNAHGYKNFPMNEDCFTEAPRTVSAPPPPPPPPPLPSHMAGVGFPLLPPLPTGVLPPVPPNSLPPVSDLIPQPDAIRMQAAPVATSVAAHVGASTASGTSAPSFSLSPPPKRKELKGGLTLIYNPEEDDGMELTMEERRASLSRYQSMIKR